MSKVYELNFIEYIVILIPALLAFAFAMVKINNIPLIKFLFLFLEFSIKPKGRVWNHRGISSVVAPDLGNTKKEDMVTGYESKMDRKAKKAANLRELTRTLDSGSFNHLRDVEHDDIDVSRDDDLVTQAYFGHKRNESETENMYWRTKDAHIKMLDAFAAMPTTKLKKGSVEAMQAQQEIAKIKKEVEGKQVVATSPPITKSPLAQSTVPHKKPRKRQRQVPKPARKGSINTTDKAQPVKIITQRPKAKNSKLKTQNISTDDQNPKISKSTSGEFDVRDLEKGEIEINLD